MNRQLTFYLSPLLVINLFFFSLYLSISSNFGYGVGLAIIVLMLAFGFLLIYSFNKPEILLLLSIIFALLGPMGSLMGSESLIPLTLFQVFLILTFIIYLIYFINIIDEKFIFPKQMKITSFFVFIIIISLVFSLDKSRALYHVFTLFTLIIMTYLIYTLFDKEKYFSIFFSAALILTSLFSIYSIYQFIQDPMSLILNALNIESKIFGRQQANWADPNDYGLILVFPLYL